MRQSALYNLNANRDVLNAFQGINRGDVIGDAEFSDMTNLTNDNYPVLATRKPYREYFGSLPFLRNEKMKVLDCVCTITGLAFLIHDEETWDYKLFYYSQLINTNRTAERFVTLPKYVEEGNYYSPEPTESRLLAIGTKVVCMPVGHYVNVLTDADDDGVVHCIQNYQYMNLGPENADLNQHTCNIRLTQCTADGEYENTYYGADAPDTDKYWYDTTLDVLSYYKDEKDGWVNVPLEYIQIDVDLTAKGITRDVDLTSWVSGFEEGDTVFIHYLYANLPQNPKNGIKIKKIIKSRTEELPSGYKITRASIVIPGTIERQFLYNGRMTQTVYAVTHEHEVQIGNENVNYDSQSGGVMRPPIIIRKMPITSASCVSNNRIWGCSSKMFKYEYEMEFYGGSKSALGKYQNIYCVFTGSNYIDRNINEISSTALGDIKNWYDYSGIATDSYAVTVGDFGKFTGAIDLDGVPHFFKRNKVYAIYGSYPAAYQLKSYSCVGALENTWQGAMNGNIYYVSTDGINAFNGNSPVRVSTKLGRDFKATFCGNVKDKLTVASGNDLYIYDSSLGIWCKYAFNDRINCIAGVGDGVYVVTKNGVFLVGDSQYLTSEDEAPIKWECITGKIGITLPDYQYYSRIVLKCEVENYANISFQYDSDGDWVDSYSIDNKQSVVSIIPRRCSHFQMKIEGEGNFKLYSITKTVEEGSDLG